MDHFDHLCSKYAIPSLLPDDDAADTGQPTNFDDFGLLPSSSAYSFQIERALIYIYIILCLIIQKKNSYIIIILQKIDYINNNPVEEGLVYKVEDYVYSSVMDYAGEQGLIEDVVVFKMFEV